MLCFKSGVIQPLKIFLSFWKLITTTVSGMFQKKDCTAWKRAQNSLWASPLIFDATSADHCGAFKVFFRDFCVMEDDINPAKPLDSEEYWIAAKCPKAMATLRQAFPQAKWDVLTLIIDSQIPEEDKQNPAQLLAKLSHHYLGGQPLIQSTYKFLRIYPSVTHSWVFGISEVQFSSAVDDWLQRDIFVIGLNDAFQRFCSDIISHKDLTSLTSAQVISKVRDCDTSIQMDSAITQ